jgi:drug/metabolite transporter (DMT)-like permease
MYSMDLTKKYWQWILLLVLAFIWGSSFILMKKGLHSFSNLQVAAFRIFFSFVFFLPFIVKHISKLNKYNVKSLLIAGFIGNGIPAFFFTTAQMQISSSFAGILNSLTPIFTLIVGVMFYRAKSNALNVVGLVLGLIGAAGLVVKDLSLFFVGNNWYGLFVVLATLFYGINVNEVKQNLKEMNGVAISALSFMFIGPFCGIYLLFSDFSYAFTTPGWISNLGFIALLAFFSSFLAVIGMNVLIKYVSPIFASSVTYVIPVFALMWGILDGEKLMAFDILWIMIVLFGVYLANLKYKRNET